MTENTHIFLFEIPFFVLLGFFTMYHEFRVCVSFLPFPEESLRSRAGFICLMNHSLMSEIRWDKNNCKCFPTLTQSCCCHRRMVYKNKNVLYLSQEWQTRSKSYSKEKDKKEKRYKIRRHGLIARIMILLWQYYI